uniref:Uncharacterized protein n=1 Tax=Anguilla anguilla TaxID=7936 RepID=A0A0E9VH55_ANGAN
MNGTEQANNLLLTFFFFFVGKTTKTIIGNMSILNFSFCSV